MKMILWKGEAESATNKAIVNSVGLCLVLGINSFFQINYFMMQLFVGRFGTLASYDLDILT